MSVDGFDGRVEEFELSLGSVTGVRGFRVDSLGRLTGVSHRKVFRPGPNVARCDKCETKNLADCTCGFYAYFQQERYGAADTSFYGGEVGAVIRGYGRTVVGTKGFRAEKADLLGFFPIETAQEPSRPVEIDALYRSSFRFLYPSVAWFRKMSDTFRMFLLIIGTIATIIGLIGTTIGALIAAEWTLFFWFLAASLVVVPWLGGLVSRSMDAELVTKWDETSWYLMSSELVSLHLACRPGPKEPTSSPDMSKFDRLRTLYPGVPVYESLREALEVHPVTAPEEHQPSPDDPDFWDVEVPGSVPTKNIVGTITGATLQSGNITVSGRTVASNLPAIQSNRGSVSFATGGRVVSNATLHVRTARCVSGTCSQCAQKSK